MPVKKKAEYALRSDGKFNIWIKHLYRDTRGEWLLVKVCATLEEAIVAWREARR
jgi:hypothetical protein